MNRVGGRRLVALMVVAAVAIPLGCGGNFSLLNPSFLNFVQGGQFPLTPGPNAAFVFVRVVNKTADEPMSFVVTAEIARALRDENGVLQRDENGQVVTELVLETHRLQTFPRGNASEAGTLFSCSAGSQAVERVGLGENLLPTDRGVFLNAVAGGVAGLGVQTGVNALNRIDGNFRCGDTITFEAIDATGVPGNVKVRAFLLPASDQPSAFSGLDTFRNYSEFLESQIREDEP